VRLDGVRQLVMTTGTSNGPDRGARHLARCVAEVRRVLPDLPIQVQLEPPVDLEWIARLHDAGTTAIGIHVESLGPLVRKGWTPGKATVPLQRYDEAWEQAVRVFGRNRVSTYLLIGLGENPDELVAGAKRLIGMGVYPFVVPYRRWWARSRTPTACPRRATRSSPTSPTASAAPCVRPACAGPTRAPAARPAAPARR
jgi:radical SAM protein (TIGR04043 family)